jgi:transcriptional regulator with XRE-family HTH domain
MQLNNLRNVRRDRGLSQRELGERIGVLQARIASIEGGTSVSPETAERLSKALLCDVGDLMRPDEPVITLRLSDISPEMLQAISKK